MEDSSQPQPEKRKSFVRRHSGVLVCSTASAVAASVITWRVSGNIMNHTLQSRHAALLLRDCTLREFVSQKGLKEEFLNEFIPSLSE